VILAATAVVAHVLLSPPRDARPLNRKPKPWTEEPVPRIQKPPSSIQYPVPCAFLWYIPHPICPARRSAAVGLFIWLSKNAMFISQNWSAVLPLATVAHAHVHVHAHCDLGRGCWGSQGVCVGGSAVVPFNVPGNAHRNFSTLTLAAFCCCCCCFCCIWLL